MTRFFGLAIFLSPSLCCMLLAAGQGAADPAGTKAQAIAAAQGKMVGYDIRINGKVDLERLLAQHRGRPGKLTAATDVAPAMKRAAADFLATQPGNQVALSPLTGSAEVVRGKVALTKPSAADAQTIARDFLRANSALYGLSPAQVDRLQYQGTSSSANGLRMVRLVQTVHGRPVFQSETKVIIDRDGQLVRTVGRLVPGLDESLVATAAGIGHEQALIAALKGTGHDVKGGSMQFTATDAGGAKGEITTREVDINSSVSSELVYFPLASGLVVPAYAQIILTSSDADWYTVVDAGDGTMLYRKNIRASASSQEARFSVYVQADGSTPADSPAPHSPTTPAPGSGVQFPAIGRTIVSMSAVQDLGASPDGWIFDGLNTTFGNNVDAYLDRNANDAPDTGALDLNGRPVGNLDSFGNRRDFLGTGYAYNPAPLGGNPNAGDNPNTSNPFKRGMVTHLFYMTNWFHDRLFNLGFDEAAGNFQIINYSASGSGNDPVLAEAQWGAALGITNNSTFSTPPDGFAGVMRMFIFNFPAPDRDGSLDAEEVLHELTHGVSNRLVGNAAGLNWFQGGAMGEGWSDFYALSLLNGTNADDPDGSYASGAYATYSLAGLLDNYTYGIRRFPYSTDNSISPLTWADTDDITQDVTGGIAVSPLGFEFFGANEVHNAGELWALTLWEMRSRIIAANGGNVPLGNQIALQLVTDGMKLLPLDPSFVDARDGLLDADCATNGCANEFSIWDGFADRGLGYGASTSSAISVHYGVAESFSVPYLDVAQVAVDDACPNGNGNGNGYIDPGETVALTLTLVNPWRGAAMDANAFTASLSSSSAEVTILDGSAAYGAIAAQNTGSGDSFTISVDPAAACGQSLDFVLETSSNLGVTSATFSLRVGRPDGPGTPVTYSRAIPGGLPIPDGLPLGAADGMTIADDLDIYDLDVRIDSLTHTWVGDLTVEFKGPSGYGADMVYNLAGTCPGSFVLGGNCGQNFINTRFDDDSFNDLLIANFTAQPFSGDWLPILNSSNWTVFDPVGQLSNFNGTSTRGDWYVFASDSVSSDSGTLNAWSLIVTPVKYVCEPFVSDTDCDGVADGDDECPGSDLAPTVVIDGCDSGVPNLMVGDGCTISDLIAECAAGAGNHGQFVSCVSHLTNDLKKAGLITGQQKGAIQSCAGGSSLP